VKAPKEQNPRERLDFREGFGDVRGGLSGIEKLVYILYALIVLYVSSYMGCVDFEGHCELLQSL